MAERGSGLTEAQADRGTVGGVRAETPDSIVADKQVVLGLLPAPGMVRDLAGDLERELPKAPSRRFPNAMVVSMLVTVGGALGAALESDEAVREAAYGYHADE